MKNICFFIGCLFTFLLSHAQNENELFAEPVVIFSHQVYGGLHVHTNGGGLYITTGKYKGAKKLRLLSFDLLYMKHEKETKSRNPLYQDPPTYVFGKTNSFFILRPGYGRKKVLTDKLRENGVGVGYSWLIGPSIGIAKPVYLDIIYQNEGLESPYVQAEKYDPDKHYIDNIYGRSSGLLGLGEMRFYPGAFFKFSLNFEYSNSKDRLKGLETGFSIDAYAKRVPIMADAILESQPDGATNHQFFINFFINIFFGKKYNAE